MLNLFKSTRWLAWPVIALVAAGCLGTCCCCNWLGPSPGLTVQDLSGEWRGPHGGTLTLRADGTYTRKDLVLCGETSAEPGRSPLNGDGVWELEEPETLDPIQEVYFDPDETRSTPFAATDEDNLFYYIGDRDSVNLCHFKRPE